LSQSPYQPPATPVRDVTAEARGPLYDWLAILIGLAVTKFLTMVVSEEIIFTLADFTGADLAHPDDLALYLLIDVFLSTVGEFVAFWMSWRLSRSRRLRIPLSVAALSLLITVVHRWYLNDFGYPLWYELMILATLPCALLLFHLAARRQGQLSV
jgi:peptidoglycan/LPS O-acetylase OafA/YrhL